MSTEKETKEQGDLFNNNDFLETSGVIKEEEKVQTAEVLKEKIPAKRGRKKVEKEINSEKIETEVIETEAIEAEVTEEKPKLIDVTTLSVSNISQFKGAELAQLKIVEENPFIEVTKDTLEEAKKRRANLLTASTKNEKDGSSLKKAIKSLGDDVYRKFEELARITRDKYYEQDTAVKAYEVKVEAEKERKRKEKEEAENAVKNQISEIIINLRTNINNSTLDNIEEVISDTEKVISERKGTFGIFDIIFDDEVIKLRTLIQDHSARLIDDYNTAELNRVTAIKEEIKHRIFSIKEFKFSINTSSINNYRLDSILEPFEVHDFSRFEEFADEFRKEYNSEMEALSNHIETTKNQIAEEKRIAYENCVNNLIVDSKSKLQDAVFNINNVADFNNFQALVNEIKSHDFLDKKTEMLSFIDKCVSQAEIIMSRLDKDLEEINKKKDEEAREILVHRLALLGNKGAFVGPDGVNVLGRFYETEFIKHCTQAQIEEILNDLEPTKQPEVVKENVISEVPEVQNELDFGDPVKSENAIPESFFSENRVESKATDLINNLKSDVIGSPKNVGGMIALLSIIGKYCPVLINGKEVEMFTLRDGDTLVSLNFREKE